MTKTKTDTTPAHSTGVAEPVARAYVGGNDMYRELCWMPDMPSFDLPVGTKLYLAAPAVQSEPMPGADRFIELAEFHGLDYSRHSTMLDFARAIWRMASTTALAQPVPVAAMTEPTKTIMGAYQQTLLIKRMTDDMLSVLADGIPAPGAMRGADHG